MAKESNKNTQKTNAQIFPSSGFITVGKGIESVACNFELIDDRYVLLSIEDYLDSDQLASVSQKLKDLQKAHDESAGI